jgi:glucokinase
MGKAYLAIDWGGTNLKLGIFDNEDLIARYQYSSPALSRPGDFFSFLREAIADALKKNGFSRGDVQGAGIGIPGLLNITEGFIYYLPNIKGWENFAFKEAFEKELGFSVVMDNDANVAALSEFRRGAAVGFKRGIVFTLGTGVGAGLFLDGKLYSGDCSSAEAGHMPINLNGKKCGCSSHGCIETLLGAKHFVAWTRSHVKKNPSSLRTVKELTPHEIFVAAKNGDKAALEAWDYYGWVLGRFSAGLVNLLDLQVIVVGGGISGAFRFFGPALKKAIKENAMRPLGCHVAVKKARFSNDAGIYGAFELAKETESRERILQEYSTLLKRHRKI